VLASDSLAGRRAESGDDLRAARYLASELDEAGCGAFWNCGMIVPFDMDGAGDNMNGDPAGDWNGVSYNVAAVVSSGYPEADKVLLGAHYDHLGLFKADRKCRWSGYMLPGANDNASGTFSQEKRHPRRGHSPISMSRMSSPSMVIRTAVRTLWNPYSPAAPGFM